jgi:hypothetical protein
LLTVVKVSFVELHVDDGPAAILLIVPSAICGKVYEEVPSHLTAQPFVAILLPYIVSGPQWENNRASRRERADTKAVMNQMLPASDRVTLEDAERLGAPSILANPAFYRALRALCIPLHLLEFYLRPNHPFAIIAAPGDGARWPEDVRVPDGAPMADGAPVIEAVETQMLRNVLSACPQEELAPDSAALRVLFVHVGSVQRLAAVPGLAERKRQFAVQIHTYGTHHDVPAARWGVKEIYPVGESRCVWT